VLRVKGTRKALALATDGKARFCHLDPRSGARLAVMEAARNVACTGARPLALVNCLNFGNPEHAEVMWQFAETVEGMSEACEALGIPVIGGNVSFYNESLGDDIHPTPVVGVLGLIDALDVAPPLPRWNAGDSIVVLGITTPEVAGSEWAAVVHGLAGGLPPRADLESARALHALVAELVAAGECTGVHDASDGGLAVALCEMAFGAGIGFRVDLGSTPGATASGCTLAEAAFGESASRVVVAVSPDNVVAVLGAAAAAGVPAAAIGRAVGDRCNAPGAFDVALTDADHVWRDALPMLMGAQVSHERSAGDVNSNDE
jgi:phosphoribosylformylglycinamidine synthase